MISGYSEVVDAHAPNLTVIGTGYSLGKMGRKAGRGIRDHTNH